MNKTLMFLLLLFGFTSCFEFASGELVVEWAICNRTDTELYYYRKVDDNFSFETNDAYEWDIIPVDSLYVIRSIKVSGSRSSGQHLDCDDLWTKRKYIAVHTQPEVDAGVYWSLHDDIESDHDIFDKYDWILLPDENPEYGVINRTWVFEIFSEDIVEGLGNSGKI